MPSINELTWGVLINLFTEFLVAVVGVLVAQRIARWWVEKRFGGWCVHILNGDQEILKRRVSAPKVKEILEEPAELSVFLKGLVSPYETLHCDIIEVAQNPGLLTIDRERKQFLVDLSRNPPRPLGENTVK